MPEAPAGAPADPPSSPSPPSRTTAPAVVLAFDFGRRRIGVACGDTVTRSAAPLGAVDAGGADGGWQAIDALVRAWRPSLVVVGLPYNADDSESAMTGEARRFGAEIARRFALPIELIDERYSSLEAGSRLQQARESGLRKRRVAKKDIDAAAACIILERWFSANN